MFCDDRCPYQRILVAALGGGENQDWNEKFREVKVENLRNIFKSPLW